MCQRLILVLGMLIAACSPALDWRETRQAELGFAVLLPGKPQVANRDLPFDGAVLPMTLVSAGRDGTLFAVGVARLPPAAIADSAALEGTLKRFAEALRRNVHGADAPSGSDAAAVAGFAGGFAGARPIRAQSSLSVRGDAGPSGKTRAVHLYARFVVADDRLYQVAALGTADELNAHALDTFFQSFRLTP